MEAGTLVDTQADKLAQSDAEIIGAALFDVKAGALVDLLSYYLA